MREEQCNLAMLLQYMIHDMLDRFEGGQEPPIHLEMGFSGGEILHYELFKVTDIKLDLCFHAASISKLGYLVKLYMLVAQSVLSA